MLITYEKFTELGFVGVEELAFNRFSIMAEQLIHYNTFNRIDAENITEINKMGICEIILILNKEQDDKNRTISSFSNARYSESYEAKQTSSEQIQTIIRTYFTAEQLFRGVDYARS